MPLCLCVPVCVELTPPVSHSHGSEPIGSSGVLQPIAMQAPGDSIEESHLAQANRRRRGYKLRVAACDALDKRLQEYVDLRQHRFPLLPDVPCLAAGDAIHLTPIESPDVIDTIDRLLTPIDVDIATNLRFESAGLSTLSSLIDRRHVIAVMQEFDWNEEVARLQQDEADIHREEKESEEESQAFLAAGTMRGARGDVEVGRSARHTRVPSERFKSCVVGTLPFDRQASFSRMLYRVSRGNALIRFSADSWLPPRIRVSEPPGESHEPSPRAPRVVFCIITVGHQLLRRIRKLIELEGGHEYDLPTESEFDELIDEERRKEERKASEDLKESTDASIPTAIPSASRDFTTSRLYQLKLSSLDTAIRDEVDLLVATRIQLKSRITQIFRDRDSQGRDICPLLNWRESLMRERVICDVLARGHFYDILVALEGWIPTRCIDQLQQAVKEAVSGTGLPSAMIEINPNAPLRTPGVPPTTFPINKFTAAFQGIVDTYGVPRYKEVNPGLFTIISFPFLFGVMYGDVGHGMLIVIGALLLILFESRLSIRAARGRMGEVLTLIFGGRYILLLMGFFAVYVGSIYNETFSIPVGVFSSGFSESHTPSYHWELGNQPFPYGLDAVWPHKQNELAFHNSFKMKLAIIIGVTQMTFGVCLSLANHIYFEEYVSAVFEFIPRILFLLAIFGYMSFLIIIKWCTDYSIEGDTQPPNLIQTMIQMFLNPGQVEPENQLYAHQATVQMILIAIAGVSVPVMLCVKPCWMNYRRKHSDDTALTVEPPDAHLIGIQNEVEAMGKHQPTNSSTDEQKSTLKLRSLQVDGLVGEECKVQPDPTSHAPSTTAEEHIQTDSYAATPHHAGSGGRSSFSSASSHPAYLRVCGHHVKGELSLSTDPPMREVSHATNPPSPPARHQLSTPEAISVHAHGKGEFDLSTELIHQAIHTIEYVLGTVSNTASYLRLWALSLAHQQLSIVFWDKALMQYGIAAPIMGLSVRNRDHRC